MVEDDVEEDLQASLVEGLHYLLELDLLPPLAPGPGVVPVRGREHGGVVPPEVPERLAGEGANTHHLVKDRRGGFLNRRRW